MAQVAGKPRPTITADVYKRLLEAFRGAPGNMTGAAKKAGCAFGTAKRAWSIGWPEHEWGRPISEVLGISRVLKAGAQRPEKVPSDQKDVLAIDALKADIAYQFAREAEILGQAQSLAGAGMAIAVRLLGSYRRTIEMIAHELTLPRDGLSPIEALQEVEKLASVGEKFLRLAQVAMEMMDARIGRPVGDGKDEDGDVDPEKTMVTMERVMRAWELMRERGLIVIQGGKDGSGEGAK